MARDKLLHFYSDAGWGVASRFFVALTTEATEPVQNANKEQSAGDTKEEIVGCVGVVNRSGGEAELQYLAVRPGAADPDAALDALLDAALAHARKAGCFTTVFTKANSAEGRLMAACQRAGLREEQRIAINAWFWAHRMACKLSKRGR